MGCIQKGNYSEYIENDIDAMVGIEDWYKNRITENLKEIANSNSLWSLGARVNRTYRSMIYLKSVYSWIDVFKEI